MFKNNYFLGICKASWRKLSVSVVKTFCYSLKGLNFLEDFVVLKRLSLFLVLIVFSSVGFSSSAPSAGADAKHTGSPKALAAINALTKDQMTVINTFDAAGDLEGFVLKSTKGAGMPVLMYADKAGKYVVYGDLFGPKGDSLSQEYHDKYVQAYVAKLVEKELSTVHTFTEGNKDAKYSMYVLADPNCIACHMFYEAVKPQLKDGTLKINWILVTFLKPDSANKAAAIMLAKDPSLAMTTNEDKFDKAHEEGGIASVDPIPADTKKQLDENMAFMANTGLSSTPTLIFYADKKLQIVAGMPRDMAGFLAQSKPTID
jgi:thiol:disulfide interchange protein DsbG